MSKIKELEDLIESKGIVGITDAVFTEHIDMGETLLPNTTVREYCEYQSTRTVGLSAEGFADEMLEMIKKTIIL